MERPTVTGGCLCGAVAFEITMPLKFVAHCHCTLCRRAHMAAFVTWVGVKAERFRLTAGAERLGRFSSSPGTTRSFCQTCGSPLLFESERWPGEVHVARAAIPGALTRKPAMHVYWDDRAPWLDLHDALPKLGGETGMEPTGAA